MEEKEKSYSELMDVVYQYSKWFFEKRQDFTKKLESRILACLTLTGVELKLVTDLFNSLPSTTAPVAFFFCFCIKVTAIIFTLWASYNLIKSLKINPNKAVKSISIKQFFDEKSRENFEKFNKSKISFQATIINSWSIQDDYLESINQSKMKSLNNAIWKMFIAGIMLGVGSIVQNVIKAQIFESLLKLIGH